MEQSARSQALSAYLRELKPRSLPASLVTGPIMGLMEVFFALSFASLIFNGALVGDLPRAAGLALASSALILIVIGLTSSQPGVFAVIQDVPAVLIAVIAGQATAGQSPAVALATTLVLLACTTFLTGAALILIGQLKLGGLVRYIPYPVVSGFLAATGWLLMTGSIPIMTGTPLTLSSLPAMFQPSQLILWLPGVAIAGAVFLVVRSTHHPLVLPAVIIGILAVFHIVLALTGTPLNRAAAMGLFPTNTISLSWSFLDRSIFLTANWPVLLKQSGNIAILIGMTLVGLMLNISAIEVVIDREFDLNHELRAAGLANLFTGLAGGYIGYQMLGNTAIACRVGVRDRATPVLGGLTALAVLFFQLPMLNLIPKALFAGMLFAFGLDFFYDGVISGWRRFSHAEYAAVLLILIVIVLTDYLTGVVVGLLAMVILFAVGYSRTRVILRKYTIGEIFSTVERPETDSLLLEKMGPEAQIFELQGFLFFGTASVLLDTFRQHLAQQVDPKPALWMIDFHAVTGIDSSAAMSFQKTWRLAEERGIQLVLTGVSPQVCTRLNLDRTVANSPVIHILDDLDHGLEWCEEQVLARHPHPKTAGEVHQDPIVRALMLAGLPQAMAIRAAPYMTQIDLPAGETLMRRGDPADELYFLVEGQVSVYRETENGLARARVLGPGSILGELALYLNQPRTADILTDRPIRLLCLQRSVLEQIRQEDPALSSTLHEVIGHQLALRARKDEHGLTVLRR